MTKAKKNKDEREGARLQKIAENIRLFEKSLNKVRINYLLKLTKKLKKKSKCLKYQTSTLICRDSEIISIGINQTLPEYKSCSHYWKQQYKQSATEISFDEWIKSDEWRNMHSQWSEKVEIHAEIAAIQSDKFAKLDLAEKKKCSLYTYYSPCHNCKKEIAKIGFKEVFYYKKYPGRKITQMSSIAS